MSGARIRIAALLASLLAACASWREPEPVAAPLEGDLRGAGELVEAVVERSVRHHDNPGLGRTDQAPIDATGHFSFPRVALPVTAKEFSKTYALTLTLVVNGERRALYRAEYSRLALPEQLTLVCDLAAADALPCRALPAP